MLPESQSHSKHRSGSITAASSSSGISATASSGTDTATGSANNDVSNERLAASLKLIAKFCPVYVRVNDSAPAGAAITAGAESAASGSGSSSGGNKRKGSVSANTGDAISTASSTTNTASSRSESTVAVNANLQWADSLKIELLRMSTLILEFSSTQFKRYKVCIMQLRMYDRAVHCALYVAHRWYPVQ